MRIVVDAMGGDHAPWVVVEGVVQAVRQLRVGVILVGPKETVMPLVVAACGGEAELASLDIAFEDAPETIAMDELPLPAIKKKKRSSIVVGLQLVRDGVGDAFVSAGNTGAVMAAATLTLKRLPGVERPALGAMIPTRTGFSVLLDVGANVEVRARHLEQFAVMGTCYYRAARGIEQPRVALLSVGEEEVKGNDLVREVHQDLKRGPVNFIGNIDGREVYTGNAHVIVTDGFTGNVILKSSESLLRALVERLRGEIQSSTVAKLGYLLLRPVMGRIRSVLDESEYGAVPLLGVGRPVFIGHGSSTAKSVFSAVREVRTFVEARVNQAIQDNLAELAETKPPVDPGQEPPAGPVALGGEA